MKNLLILFLLILSPHLSAQNSSMNYGKSSLKNSGSELVGSGQVSIGYLSPVDWSPEKKSSGLLLSDNSNYTSLNDSDGFSSLVLMDQLKQMDQSTPFNVNHNATLERFIRVYLKDRRAYINRLIGKSVYYFPFFEQYLDTYDLPLELKYLAVVESALNPVAISPSGAKGLWQFMYGTGMEYDLYIDSYVDERFDLIKSTRAACAYLQKLHNMFGDWDLALAAYNSGPGNVRKAIKRAGGNTNYWEIRQFLPRETSSYVPAFYATMYLFTHVEYHKLSPLKGEASYFETDTVQLKGSLTFEAIQKNTGINMDILTSFNPVYKKGIIPELPDRTMTLTLPVTLMPRFLAAEKILYKKSLGSNKHKGSSKIIPISTFNSYLVQDGDNLHTIAKKHHISLIQLKTWNGLDSNFLISGQRLVVTNQKGSRFNKIKDTGAEENKKVSLFQNTSQFTNYTVEYGDTLFKISRKFGNIPISELRATNALENINYLKPGTKLRIRRIRTDNKS